MAGLYVASTEAFVGKSAVCTALVGRMQRDGLTVRYMKPVSSAITQTAGGAFDEDAVFMRQTFGLQAAPEELAPLLLRRSTIEAVLQGASEDWAARITSAYAQISAGADVTILEGTNNWSEGALLDLSADRVAEVLDAPMLLVARYRSLQSLDTLMAVQRFMGSRLRGVLLNQLDEASMGEAQAQVVPFLEGRGIPVLGLLPRDARLAGIPVDTLAAELGGQVVGGGHVPGAMIETMMIGAMNVETGLSHFRRRANKAVVTGGDRADLHLAALETSTNALVLTGNIRPAQQVLDRAEQRNVPIIVVAEDTLTVVERIEHLFAQARFNQQDKLERFTQLMDERFDWPRLYALLGLRAQGGI